MSKKTNRDDLVAALTCAGDAFTGGHVEDVASEWCDNFDDLAVAIRWIAAGYWDAYSAAQLAGLGADPEAVKYQTGREKDHGYGIDPVYAFCNGDCDLADLTW